jgi:hypothetical protein
MSCLKFARQLEDSLLTRKPNVLCGINDSNHVQALGALKRVMTRDTARRAT